MGTTWATFERLAFEYREMQKWIKKYVEDHGFDNVIIGLSGGFDSSFLAFMCSDKNCLGNEKVWGVSMPCDSSQESLYDAQELTDRLGIHLITNELEAEVAIICNGISYNRREEKLPPMTPTEIGNVKARMRMITLYGYAPALNALVLNTSNYSEAMAGNGTKYGDITGDIAPFLGYTKTSLYRMAQAVGFATAFPKIMNKTPSADLEPDQTDEKTMGVSYLQLDAFIEQVDTDEDRVPIVFDEAILGKIKKLITRSVHKRNPMPVFCY